MRIKSWTKVAAVLVAGASLTLVMPALAAVGDASPPQSALQIGPNAKLIARGVAAEVKLNVVCPPGVSNWLTVSLAEATGRTIARGSTSSSVTCTGTFQDVTVLVQSQTNPFRHGQALAQAGIFGFCFPGPCSATDTKVVRLSSR